MRERSSPTTVRSSKRDLFIEMALLLQVFGKNEPGEVGAGGGWWEMGPPAPEE
jgi:hypothetical protein